MTKTTKLINIAGVIFDLDGTLLDTLPDIAFCMNAVLKDRGLPSRAPAEFQQYIGDGIHKFVASVLPEAMRTREGADACVADYRRLYAANYNRAARPYPGMTGTLDGLAARGMKLAVLSNKLDAFTKKCIADILPGRRFDMVMGQTDDTPPKPDPAGALKAAAGLGLSPERILFVGDSDVDMKTALAAGMHPAGAVWGYRSREELMNTGAEILLERPPDILNILDASDEAGS